MCGVSGDNQQSLDGSFFINYSSCAMHKKHKTADCSVGKGFEKGLSNNT